VLSSRSTFDINFGQYLCRAPCGIVAHGQSVRR
jgi:hypothetical protein